MGGNVGEARRGRESENVLGKRSHDWRDGFRKHIGHGGCRDIEESMIPRGLHGRTGDAQVLCSIQ